MGIRVLHVVDQLEYGGTAMAVKNIAENIAKERIETFVCALRKTPKIVPIKAKLITLSYQRFNPLAVLAIVKLCRYYRIDIIHAHLQKSIISSLLASFFCNSKVVIQDRGKILAPNMTPLYGLFLKLLGSRSAVVMANCQKGKMALIQSAGFSEESVKVVNSFIDFNCMDYTRYDRNKTRSRFGISDSHTVVGLVGRLTNQKGVDFLIDAAAILCESYASYRFIIVGEGPLRKRLQRQVYRLGLKDKVIFTGLCKNPAEIMKAFDIAVIPSRYEGFGTVAVEFMRMRIPVIASPVGGLPELVQDGKTGILLDELSDESIVRAVNRLLYDASLRENLVNNAEAFSCNFDGRRQLKQLEQIYKVVAQGDVP